MKSNTQKLGNEPQETKPNQLIKTDRAKVIAEIFSAKAESYRGDIMLPIDIISTLTRDLKKVKVNVLELTQLDEKPYAVLPHDLATRSHWFMRRFRNSGGWRGF